jgi:hypothetical protein
MRGAARYEPPRACARRPAGFNRYPVNRGMLLLRQVDPFLITGVTLGTVLPLLWVLVHRRTPVGGRLQLRGWAIGPKQVPGGAASPAGLPAGGVVRDVVAERDTARRRAAEPAQAEI